MVSKGVFVVVFKFSKWKWVLFKKMKFSCQWMCLLLFVPISIVNAEYGIGYIYIGNECRLKAIYFNIMINRSACFYYSNICERARLYSLCLSARFFSIFINSSPFTFPRVCDALIENKLWESHRKKKFFSPRTKNNRIKKHLMIFFSKLFELVILKQKFLFYISTNW